MIFNTFYKETPFREFSLPPKELFLMIKKTTFQKPDRLHKKMETLPQTVSFKSSQLLHCALIALFCLTLYLAGNDRSALWDRDEPRFAQATREMLKTGDFVVPHFNGEIRYDKPVLIYWLMGASYSLFGVNEFAARFISALAGTAAVITLYFIALSLFDHLVALFSAVILALSMQMFVAAKFAITDATLLFFILISFLSYLRLYEGKRKLLWSLILYAALALQALTKGPVGPAVFILTILGFSLFSKNLRPIRTLGSVWGILLFLIILTPWLVLVQKATGGKFLAGSLGRHVLERSLSPREGHSGLFFYYLLILIPLFFPWITFLPSAIYSTCKKSIKHKPVIFLLSWIALPFVMFSVIRTKLPHYILPIYPALSIIVAAYFRDVFISKQPIWEKTGGKISALAFAVLALLFAAGLPVLLIIFHMPRPIYAYIPSSIILLIATALFLRALIQRHDTRAFAFLTLSTSLFLITFILFTVPSISSYNLSKPLAKAILSEARTHDTIAALNFAEPSLVFYLGNRPDQAKKEHSPTRIILKDDDDFLNRARKRDGRLLAVMPKKDYLRLKKMIPLEKLHEAKGFNFAKGKWVELVATRTSN